MNRPTLGKALTGAEIIARLDNGERLIPGYPPYFEDGIARVLASRVKHLWHRGLIELLHPDKEIWEAGQRYIIAKHEGGANV